MLAQLRLGYERLRAMGRGGNQENLNLNLVGAFRVLVPSIAQQAAFVKRIDTIENTRAAGKSSLAELDALFASLQQRAFRGESWPSAAISSERSQKHSVAKLK